MIICIGVVLLAVLFYVGCSIYEFKRWEKRKKRQIKETMERWEKLSPDEKLDAVKRCCKRDFK